MRTAIVIVKAIAPCLMLGAISLILLANMGCREVEPVQAVEQDETKMMTVEEINRELELDICDIQKLELIPYTEPTQFITTLRRH